MRAGAPAMKPSGWVRVGAALVGSGLAGTAGLPTIALAQDTSAPGAEALTVDTAMYQRLLDHLGAGERQAAVDLIASVETLTGDPGLAANRNQFVDLLLGCPGTITRQRQFGRDSVLLTAEFQCAGRKLTAVLSDDASHSYVVVADLADEAMLAQRDARPRALRLPPAPRPLAAQTPEQQAAAARLAQQQSSTLQAFAAAVQANTPAALADLLMPEATFSYGSYDPIARTSVRDLQGTGVDAAREQLAQVVADLDRPIGFSCEAGALNVCRWQFERQPQSLMAFVFMAGARINQVQFTYLTPAVLERAARRATPEQLQTYAASLREDTN